MNKKYIIITAICTVLSIISGILTKDLIIGGTILLTGLLCAYFASEGKRINYIIRFNKLSFNGVCSIKE